MFRRYLKIQWLALAVCCVGTWLSAGCNQVDLETSLELAEVTSGYHDAGLNDLGANKLVPSLSFRLRNVSANPVSSIDLIVYFWGVENDSPRELDEIIVTGIGSDGLASQASTEPIVVRSKQGFALEQQARSELFNHRLFRDVTAKVFLKRGGRIVPVGEYTIERRLLLAAPSGVTTQ